MGRTRKSEGTPAKALARSDLETGDRSSAAHGRVDSSPSSTSNAILKDIDRAIDQAWDAATDPAGKAHASGRHEVSKATGTVASVNGGDLALAAHQGALNASSTPSAAEARAAGGLEGGGSSTDDKGGEMAGEGAVLCGVGITLNMNVDGDYMIKAVAPGGPADIRSKVGGNALIAPGDLLEGVDGRGVRDVSYADLAHRILGPAGTKVQVAVRRGNKLSKHSLTRSPLGDGAQQAVKQGIVREQKTLKHMLRMARKLEKEKEAMATEMSKLRERAENAEQEARVWKAISQQNSQATSQAASPAESDDDSAEEL